MPPNFFLFTLFLRRSNLLEKEIQISPKSSTDLLPNQHIHEALRIYFPARKTVKASNLSFGLPSGNRTELKFERKLKNTSHNVKPSRAGKLKPHSTIHSRKNPSTEKKCGQGRGVSRSLPLAPSPAPASRR